MVLVSISELLLKTASVTTSEWVSVLIQVSLPVSVCRMRLLLSDRCFLVFDCCLTIVYYRLLSFVYRLSVVSLGAVLGVPVEAVLEAVE